MNKEEIINTFLNNKSFKKTCKRVDYKNWEDLYQELCCVILEMPQDKLMKAYSCWYFNWMIVRIILNIKNNKQRPQSPLYMSSNCVYEIDLPIDDNRVNVDQLDELLKNQLERDEQKYFFESRLMKAYLKYGSYRKLAKEADIPYNTIQNTLQPYIKELRKKLLIQING